MQPLYQELSAYAMPCRSPNIVQFYGASASQESVMLVTEVGGCKRAAAWPQGFMHLLFQCWGGASSDSLPNWPQVSTGSQWLTGQ